MPKASEKSNSRRSRSFGGCGTCRKRHVKCDQVRPVCLTCKAVGAECDGFSAEIRWMKSSKDGIEPEAVSVPSKSGATRRHLFSERERERMSSSMTSEFQIGSVDASLSELDSRSKDVFSTKQDIAVGPFGVLSFVQPNNTVKSVAKETEPPTDGSFAAVTTPPRVHEQILIGDVTTQDTPITLDSFMGLDDSLQWADLFGFHSSGLFLDHSMLDPYSTLGDGNSVLYPNAVENDVLGVASSFHANKAALSGAGSRLTPAEHSSITIQDVLPEAQMLLRHFRDNVMRRWSCLPITSKSPWELIMLSEAVKTLAYLTFMGAPDLSCAKKANLYGMLSISSLHLSRISSHTPSSVHPPGHWHTFTKFTTNEARKNLQQSLRIELSGTRKAKYKDQMSAILSLLGVAFIAGDYKEARCHLIDCERLMRTRGLAKRVISRKSRLLHHSYTWQRIMGESTYVLHEHRATSLNSAQTPVQLISREPDLHYKEQLNGHGSRLDDFLRLELHQEDSDLEIEQVKEPRVSLHDIHLEDSRENPDTMYTDIYGISETWLSLLSQATRLANKMDAVKACNSCDATILNALQRRAARLEDMICSFAARFAPRSTAPSRAPNNHMHRALNSALVIFFYRRIKDVNAWILQSHVEDVISALEEFDASLTEKAGEGPGTPWPAFMAGCEAVTSAKREILLKWIEKGAATTGFSCYDTAKELLLEVWNRRDEPVDGGSTGSRATRRGGRLGQSSATWIDVSRDKQMWLMAF